MKKNFLIILVALFWCGNAYAADKGVCLFSPNPTYMFFAPTNSQSSCEKHLGKFISKNKYGKQYESLISLYNDPNTYKMSGDVPNVDPLKRIWLDQAQKLTQGTIIGNKLKNILITKAASKQIELPIQFCKSYPHYEAFKEYEYRPVIAAGHKYGNSLNSEKLILRRDKFKETEGCRSINKGFWYIANIEDVSESDKFNGNLCFRTTTKGVIFEKKIGCPNLKTWVKLVYSHEDSTFNDFGMTYFYKTEIKAVDIEDIEKNKKLEEERKKIAEEKRKLEEEKKRIAEEKRKIEEEKRQKEEEKRNYLALVKNFGPECESSWRNFWTGHNVGTPEFDKCLVDKKQENDKKILVQKNKEEEEEKAKQLEKEKAEKAKQLEKEKAEKEFAKLTAEEKRAYTCTEIFGFRKGTDKFKDCVFQIYAAELELAKLEVERQLAESQLEIAKANREAAEARAEATRQAALRAEAEANAAKAQKLTEQAQLEAAQALVEATNQQTAQMKANAKQAEMNTVMSILSQRLGTAGSGACSIVNGNLKCY